MTTANPFAPAVKRALKARVAFAGPTGSGKTYTALTWATKLGKRIAFVDTERGRVIESMNRTEPIDQDPTELISDTLARLAHPSIRPGRAYYGWRNEALPHSLDALGIPVRLDDRLPPDTIVFAQDPTTLRIDGPLDERYCEIAARRMGQEVLPL